MASILGNKRRSKLVTPANSSFSNCVQDNLFIQPLRGPLDDFKPVVYLDEHGRKHGRVSDHLLQKQIETDRQKLRKPLLKKVPPSSNLYGIRNPNVAAMVKGVPIDRNEDEEEDEEKLKADEEIKFIEYKKSSKGGTAKGGNRQISSISGKQSVKFDTTPSVNMARLVDSHLTELDDIDDEDEGDGSEELESIKPISDPDSSNGQNKDQKTPFTFSETPSTPTKEAESGIPTNSTLDYARASEELQMPPSVEDVIDDSKLKRVEKMESSEKFSSSPDGQIQGRDSSAIDHRQNSSSFRPRTSSSSGKSRSIEQHRRALSSRTSSTSSDDTSALLRSDNDDDLRAEREHDHDDDDESESHENGDDEDGDMPYGKQQRGMSRSTPAALSQSRNSAHMDMISSDKTSSNAPVEYQSKVLKGDYDPNEVIQLKESFQPIINEAASYGHLDIVRKLIESGQSVHTQNVLQRTPLHEACVSGNGQLVAALIETGALIDQQDSQGMSPLHVAARHGSLKCLRILCEKGCDVNIQDNYGNTAVHHSAMHNHLECVKHLVEKKRVNLFLRNHESKLAIHCAAKHGSKDILRYFFEIEFNAFVTDIHGNNIAHEACEYNQLDCLKLIQKFARGLLVQENQSGRTPAHSAAFHGSTRVLHWLLELKTIQINQVDKDGYTMAHLAASRGRAESFSCLMQHGAQLDEYTTDSHESVIDLGKRSGKFIRIDAALKGAILCSACQEKKTKEEYDRAHARNQVEQLIHTQIVRGYHLNLPISRSSPPLSQRHRSTK